MPPSAMDKEKLVIDLLKKGYKTREITKLAHVSNTTVKKIRAKLTAQAKEEQEQQGDQRKKPLSVSSQAAASRSKKASSTGWVPSAELTYQLSWRPLGRTAIIGGHAPARMALSSASTKGRPSSG